MARKKKRCQVGFSLGKPRCRVISIAGTTRRLRCSDGGYVYHVLNRAVGRAQIFDKSADYAAFEKVLRQARERTGMRLLACIFLP